MLLGKVGADNYDSALNFEMKIIRYLIEIFLAEKLGMEAGD